MTFREIESTLPNGFHDSAIRGISLDLVNRSILIAMDILVGVPGDADPERYRSGTVRVACPYFSFLQPPDPNYSFVPRGGPVNVSGFAVKPGENPKIDALLRRIPEDATAFGFFLEDWNTYLYLAGASVEFSWDDDAG